LKSLGESDGRFFSWREMMKRFLLLSGASLVALLATFVVLLFIGLA
jgi:hypothetical protein